MDLRDNLCDDFIYVIEKHSILNLAAEDLNDQTYADSEQDVEVLCFAKDEYSANKFAEQYVEKENKNLSEEKQYIQYEFADYDNEYHSKDNLTYIYITRVELFKV